MLSMPPRIAIPLPTSANLEYNRQNWRNYADAVSTYGGIPVEVALRGGPRAVAELAASCQAILLPGSPADVNPAKYGQQREEACAPADTPREDVDELLLQDAHNLHKPILGICFGAQMLNVWRSGTLIQDLSVLPVNHAASRSVMGAHSAVSPEDSLLASLIGGQEGPLIGRFRRISINSSHHQAIGIPGDGLRIAARCPEDGVIEAVEGAQHANSGHFVLGVQWHPERTSGVSALSAAIFSRFVAEAFAWSPRAITTSVVG
jgi:putative glutamine amidotransferase